MNPSPAKYNGKSRSSFYRKIRRLKSQEQTCVPPAESQTSPLEPISHAHQENELHIQSTIGDANECNNREPEGPLVVSGLSSSAQIQTTVENINEDDRVSDGNLMIAALASKHNWSFECLEDVCKTFARFGDNLHDLKLNKKSFHNALNLKSWGATYGWCCTNCNLSFYFDLFDNPMSRISCDSCGAKPDNTSDHYVLFNIKVVLEKIIPVLVSKCCESNHDHHFRRQILNNIPGTSNNDFSITLNTDGVPLFKSSKCSIWPVLGYLNYGNLLQQRQNVILIGLWIGRQKPDFTHFLWKIVNQLMDLGQHGVRWRNEMGTEVVSKLFVSFIMCDSIARPLVQGTSQFNAGYGCNYCYHKSINVDGFKSHYYRHSNSIEKRSMENMLVDIERLKMNQDSRGVKLISPFKRISYFDLIIGFPPDVMHCCYLGVVRQLTNCWLNSNNHSKLYYLGTKCKLAKIDQYLLSIKPPSRVHRVPRSMEHRKFFKAHEWQAWLLYYSPLILSKLLPDVYFRHWMLLVGGIATLTLDYMNNVEIENARKLLWEFSEKMENLYGPTQCTYNVHLLLHLPDFVNVFGPLQYFSMYPFESFNQQILKYVSGSQYVSYQIAKKYLQDLITKYDPRSAIPESDYAHFLKMIKGPSERKGRKVDCVAGELSTPLTITNIRDTQWNIIHSYIDRKPLFFQRLRQKGQLSNEIIAEKSICLRKHNNACVFIEHNLAIEVNFFMFLPDTNECYAVGNLHSITKSNMNLPHCYMSLGSRKNIVEVSLLKSVLMKIDSDQNVYFFSFLNYVDNNLQ